MRLQRHIEPDHLGSPRKVIEPSRGTALWDWPILGNAFGTAAANDDADGDGNATALNLRFPGQQYDAATGLHYNYFRDYDPSTGRYVESDPIGLRGGVSTYGYSKSSALMYIDRLGLEYDWGNQWKTPEPQIPPAWCGPGLRPVSRTGGGWSCEPDPWKPNPQPWCIDGQCSAMPPSRNNQNTFDCISECFDDFMPNIPTPVAIGFNAVAVVAGKRAGGIYPAWQIGVGVGCWITCGRRGAQ